MIKKAQIKFIAITMAIIFAVFTAIYVGLFAIMKSDVKKNAEITLSTTLNGYSDAELYLTSAQQNDRESKNQLIQENGIVVDLENNPVIYYYDADVYTESQAQKLVNEFISKSPESGKIYSIGNVFFTKALLSGKTYIVASDMSENVRNFHINLTYALLILLLIYFLLFTLVWALSFKVFKPIKLAFIKQKKFVSDAGHELKTPIAIINANLDVIKQTENEKWIRKSLR